MSAWIGCLIPEREIKCGSFYAGWFINYTIHRHLLRTVFSSHSSTLEHFRRHHRIFRKGRTQGLFHKHHRIVRTLSFWHLASLANWGHHCRHHGRVLHICGEALPTIASSKCHIHWHYHYSFCTSTHLRPPSVIHSKHCHLAEISRTLRKAGHWEITSSYLCYRSCHSQWHVRRRSSSRGPAGTGLQRHPARHW